MIELTPEYIKQQSIETCEKLLKQLFKDPDLNKPLIGNPDLLSRADELANTICYLEDRIHYLTQLQNLDKANAARWGRVAETQQDN